MNVINRITIDLLGNGRAETVHVVQGDAYSRTIDIDLRQWRTPWTIPEGVSVVVEYYKPDGTKGLYDKLPDGTPAWSAAGNILTIQLAPQMLTVSGTVVAQVRMMEADAVLSLFKFNVFVHQKITGNGSEDYTNWNKLFLPQVNGATVGKYLEIEEVDEDGKVTKLRPTNGPQVDWNASKNSPGYIENRTHYEASTIEIVPVSGVWESYKVASGETHWIYRFTEPLNLEDGARYTVTFGTQGYKCTAKKEDRYISLHNVGIPSIPENHRFMIFVYFEKQADGYWGNLSMMDGNKSDFTIYENKTIIHKLDEKYLPDSVATKEYVDTAIKNIDIPEPETAQPDWNAAEGEPGHILNRTHWVEGGMVEILPEITMTKENAMEVMAKIPPLGLVVGDSYTVKVNGVEYPCVAEVNEISGTTMVTLIINELNMFVGELPTDVAAQTGMNVVIEADADLVPLPVICSIYKSGEIVHKLPGKFLPDGVPYVEQGGMAEIPVSGMWVDDGSDTDDDGVIDEHEWMFAITAPLGLEIGKNYVINWDGTDYEVTGLDALQLTGGEMPGVFLGNAVFGGLEDTGEPFVLLEASLDAGFGTYGIAMALDGSGNIPFTIKGSGETIHKLDNRCLDMDYIKESLNVAADTVKVNLADMGLEVVNLGRTIGTTGFANLIRDVVGPITRGAKVLLDFKYNFIGTERTYHGYVTDWEVVELYGEALTMVHVLEGNDIYLVRIYISLDHGRIQTNVFKLAAELTATEV